MSTGSLLGVVTEQAPLQMRLGSQEVESDEEAFVLTSDDRQDQVRREPPRFASHRTLAFFGFAAALLLFVVSFTAGWASIWPGFGDASPGSANKVATKLLSAAEESSKDSHPIDPFEGESLKAEFEETSANTFFEEIQMGDGTVSYRHRTGLFVTAKKGEKVVSSRSVPGSTQFFAKTTYEDGTIALMVHGGTWLTSLPSGTIVADGHNVNAWQIFKEKKGDNGTVALRSSHGKYLGVKTVGTEFAADRSMLTKDDGGEAVSVITTAEADSVGKREKFTIVNNTIDKTVSFKTPYNTFLSSPPKLDGLVSGDSTVACGREAFTLIHKHGKVYLHTFDGRYVTALRHGFLVGDAVQPGMWESFDMTSNDDGTVALKSCHGKYVTTTKVPLLPDGGDWAFAV